MIPKGNQRAGGQQLATHLMNSFDNDRVEVAEVRGAIAQDLHGAFAEWYAQSKTTNCRKYIYSLSINPDHRQGPFTREHYYDFIRRTEKRLRLENQPRAVVFHVKYGREHCHVIWSRIDAAKGKAVQISHDHQKLRMIAREYAQDHKLTLPPGMRKDRGKARFAFRAAAENLGEKQQQERSGISKQQRRAQITKLWSENPNARSFVKALEANGYFLARGDRRAYVVVDMYGEIHSLSRQLDGVKAKEMKARLGTAYDPERLPEAVTAQKWASDKREALLLQTQKQKAEEQKRTSLEKRAAAAKETSPRRRDDLASTHAARRAGLDTKKQQLAQRHDAERRALADLQSSRNAEIARQRSARQPKGVIALLARVTGYDALTTYRQKRHDRKMEEEFKAQKDALGRRHAREMEDFKHRERGLTSLEKRERRSLETALRREAFRRIAAPEKAIAPEKTPEKSIEKKPPAIKLPETKVPEKAVPLAAQFREAAKPTRAQEQKAKVEDFKKTAAEITAPQKTEAAHGKDAVQPVLEDLRQIFAEAATGAAGERLAAKFNEKAADKEQTLEKPVIEKSVPPPAPEILKPELTPAQRRALDLAKAFNERAGVGRKIEHEDKKHIKRYRRIEPDRSLRR